jgi:hypothetical protein
MILDRAGIQEFSIQRTRTMILGCICLFYSGLITISQTLPIDELNNLISWQPFIDTQQFVNSEIYNQAHSRKFQMKYIVNRTTQVFKPDGNWNKQQYARTKVLNLGNFMGEKPRHFPQVEARLVYDDNSIYVIFKTDDNYVKAVHDEYDSLVCQDSCVEFFFTPSGDVNEGYFSIEINCCGTMLFRHQKLRGIEQIAIDLSDARKLELFSTFKSKIDPEITQPTQWFIEFKIPHEVLKKYAPFTKPGPGVKWFANFYKCADNTSHPHWLTWSKIDKPMPDFHRPEYFGILEFTGETR